MHATVEELNLKLEAVTSELQRVHEKYEAEKEEQQQDYMQQLERLESERNEAVEAVARADEDLAAAQRRIEELQDEADRLQTIVETKELENSATASTYKGQTEQLRVVRTSSSATMHSSFVYYFGCAGNE